MISIRSSADMARALDGPLDPDLRRLLALRRDQLVGGGGADLGDLAHFVVACPRDTLAAVEAEAGIPIARDPPFEWVRRHGGWLEAAVVMGDDGFALVLLVPDRLDVDPALLLPLLAHA